MIDIKNNQKKSIYPEKYPYLWNLFFLSAFEALATVIYLFCMPADPKNSIFLGYSARRLAVIGLVFIFMIISAVLAELGRRGKLNTEDNLDRFIKPESNFRYLVIIGTILFTACWILAWSPPYRFRPYDLLYKGLLPVILLATVILGQAMTLILIRKYGLHINTLRNSWHQHRKGIIYGLISFFLILLLWLLIALTRIGLIPDTAYWNSIGVPIQSLQVMISLLIGLGTILFVKNEPNHPKLTHKKFLSLPKNIDLWIFISIFLFTSTLWVTEPQVKSFFAPAPRPPNDEWYPVSDAASYDIAAQFALIGEGLDSGEHVDKPLYSTFLVLVHIIAGQRMENVVNFQATFLALIPALIFLIGLYIHSRLSGIVAALLAAFKGRNAIASAWMILSANPTILISEYLMTLGLVLLALFLILWLSNPQKKYLYGLAAGAMMGLCTLVRHNAWILPPFVILITWIAFGRKWWSSIAWSFILLGALLTSIAAWSWRTYIVTGEPWYFLGPLHGVIIDQRYLPEEQTQEDEGSEISKIMESQTQKTSSKKLLAKLVPQIATPSPEGANQDQFSIESLTDGVHDDYNKNIIYSGDWIAEPYPDHYQRTAHISCIVGNTATFSFIGDQFTLVFPTHPNRGVLSIELDGTLVKNLNQKTNQYHTQERWGMSRLASEVHVVKLTHVEETCVFLDAIIIGEPPPPANARFPSGDELYGLLQSIFERVPSHFFHNFVTTTLMLPTQLRNDDLENMTLSPGTLWQSDWQGYLGVGASIFLFINLIMVSVGIGFSFGKQSLSGLAPLVVYIAYSLGIALARTSGGRYIVPIDWILPLYFAIGLSQFIFWIFTLFGHQILNRFPTEHTQLPKQNSRHSWWWKSLLAVVGIFIIGATPLISEHIFPKHYPDHTKQEVLEILEQRGAIDKMGYTYQDIQAFILQEHSMLRIGRVLYPRFYHANTGEPAKGAYRFMDYQRLVITFIGPRGGFNGILPIDTFPNYVPNTADVAVLGCDNSTANLLALVVMSNEDIIYVRSPEAALSCPLPDPICDGNGICR